MARLGNLSWQPPGDQAPVNTLPALTTVTFNVTARPEYDGVEIEYQLLAKRLCFSANPPREEQEESSPELGPGGERSGQVIVDWFPELSGSFDVRRWIEVDRGLDEKSPRIETLEVAVFDVRINGGNKVRENRDSRSATLTFEVLL